MRKITVEFCPIDAKDNAVCGYSPVAFVVDGRKPLPLGPETGRMAVLMQREYLTRLKKLQEEIAQRYLALARHTVDEAPTPEDDNYGYGMSKTQYALAQADALRTFPGPEAEYYT